MGLKKNSFRRKLENSWHYLGPKSHHFPRVRLKPPLMTEHLLRCLYGVNARRSTYSHTSTSSSGNGLDTLLAGWSYFILLCPAADL